LCIEEVYPRRIGGIPIRDEDNRVFRIGGADRFLHGNDCRERLSGIRDMVCGDLETFGRDEEKDVVLFPHDLDVGFIACADGIDRPFVFQVDAVAIEGSGGGIVEHSLGGDSDIEYGPQDEGSLSGADGKGYVEGKDKAEDIGRVVDFDEIHTGSPRGGMDQFSWSVMIFPILVAELKLGTSFFRKGLFCIIECIHLPYPVETMVIAALVDGNLFSLFPGE
jgi:hypothetical protein